MEIYIKPALRQLDGQKVFRKQLSFYNQRLNNTAPESKTTQYPRANVQTWHMQEYLRKHCILNIMIEESVFTVP